MKFWVHRAMHSILLEMVNEISHGFFSDLCAISRCEIYQCGIVPTQDPCVYYIALLETSQ